MKAAPAEEDLKGNPRSIRVDARDNGSSEIHLQAFLDYFPGARLRQSQSFCQDGSFSYFVLCEYAGDNHLFKETIYWQGNPHTETVRLPKEESGVQMTITRSATGHELERIISRCNGAGHPVECSNSSESGEAHLVAHYDNEGTFLNAKATLPDGTELTFHGHRSRLSNHHPRLDGQLDIKDHTLRHPLPQHRILLGPFLAQLN
jgi:hypothetical protein